MSYDLSALARVQQRFVRRGTSLFIETYDQDTNTILDSFEFTNAPQALPTEVQDVARQRLVNLVSPVSGAGIPARTTTLRAATFGDSTADVTSSNSNTDIGYTTTFATHSVLAIQVEKWQLPNGYKKASLVANGGISGQTTTQMLARDTLAASATRKSIQDVIDLRPDVILLRAGSINDLTTVTSATVAAAVATSYANHVAIINRFLSAGIFVIDEGLYGYSGTGATDPVSTRAGLVQLNAMFKAFAATTPGVVFIDWVGVLSNADGSYINSSIYLADGLGIHLSGSGQTLAAVKEAAAVQQLFGASAGPRFPGKNAAVNAATASTGGNSLMAATGGQSYGTVATGFAIGVANGTRQNAKVEVINGKVFQTCEVAPTAAACYLAIYAPLDAANWVPAVGDKWGVEFDWFVSGIGGAAPPNFTSFAGAWDFTTGGNTIVLQLDINTRTFAFTTAGGITGSMASPEFTMPADTAALTACNLYIKVQSDDQVPWKLGMANPRLVKLT